MRILQARTLEWVAMSFSRGSSQPRSPSLQVGSSPSEPPGKPINKMWGCPSGPVVKNPPANAGDTGSISYPGRSHMPRSNEVHAPQLLSLGSRAQELRLMEPMCPRARTPQQEKPLRWEARILQLKSSPQLSQLEKSPCSKEDLA